MDIQNDYQQLLQDISDKTFTKEEYNIDLKNIMKYQPLVNIGSIGHVSHGKSSFVYAVTGKKTQQFKSEMERDITIKLGYANGRLYWNKNDKKMEFINEDLNDDNYELISHFSFIDSPGHESFMATMVSGTKSMNAVLLLIAANDKILPQPQTFEHISVISNTDIKNLLILQNKTDLVDKKELQENYEKIKEFITDSPYENSIIIPISAQLKSNLDYVAKYISSKIEIPTKDYYKDPYMNIIRSFDINPPNIDIYKLKGGVIGGSIKQGIFCEGEYVEIRPGVVQNNSGEFTIIPIIGQIMSIKSENTSLKFAIPGGLIAFSLNIDPTITKGDILVGNIVGSIGKLPPCITEIVVNYKKMNRLDSLKASLSVGEKIIVSYNGLNIQAIVKKKKTIIEEAVTNKKNTVLYIQLNKPLCIFENDTISIFKIDNHKIKLSGWGNIIKRLKEVDILFPSNYENYINLPKPNIVINNNIEFDESKYMDKDVINQSQFDYNNMVNDALLKGEKQIFNCNPPKTVYKNKLTYFLNFIKMVEKFQKDKVLNNVCYKDLFIKYISYELHVECNLNADNQLLIKGRFGEKHLEQILRSFIKKYIICYQCNNNCTEIIKINRLYFVECKKCFSKKPISVSFQ